MQKRTRDIINYLNLRPHEEGGYYSEAYTVPESFGTARDGRPLAGSIYFLLDGEDVSHFHQIDSDELWYIHEGCGVIVYLLFPDGTRRDLKLSGDCTEGSSPMVIVPAGTVFAAENIDHTSYTLMSCMTAPKFHYSGFRLVSKTELQEKYPEEDDLPERLAFS